MDHKPLPSLTQQEKRILQLVAQGLTNKEIARSLGLNEFHVRNIFQKLEVSSRTAAATAAGKLGLLE